MKVISVNRRVQDFESNPVDAFSTLNQMGAEGWELVAVVPLIPPNPNAINPRGVWSYLLKRDRTAG